MEAVSKLQEQSEVRQTVQVLRYELDNCCYRQPAKREALQLALVLMENPMNTDTAYFVLRHIHQLAENLAGRTVVDMYFRQMFDEVSSYASLR